MATVRSIGKRERLEARVTAQQKELFQRAADLSGRTLSDFIVDSLQAKAEEAIRNYQLIELTAASSADFADSLLNPPPPNDYLRAAGRRYRRLVNRA